METIDSFTFLEASAAFWFSSLIILEIFSVEFLVFSDNCRISFATTAKPFPASPARALSIAAFSASRFVWLEILKIIFAISCTSFVFSCNFSIDLMTRVLVFATFADCSFRLFITCKPSVIDLEELFAIATILSERSTVLLMDCWIDWVITVCSCIFSAVTCVPADISLIAELTVAVDSSKLLTS